MKIYRGINDRRLRPCPRAVTIGIFDGVHRGHQKIIGTALKEARALKLRSMVVTFDPHPSRILHPEKSPAVILSLEHRLRFFGRMGADETLVIPFDRKFSKIPRERFLEEILGEKLGMKSLTVGHDFRFGYQGLGDEKFLKQKAGEMRFRLRVVRAFREKGHIVSSTLLRKLIEKGDLAKARQMLGRRVRVHGTVVHGHGRGRKIGFPTANLNPHHETLPPAGVYAAWGYIGNKRFKGMVHIGQKPTFGDREKSLEVHFLDFKGGSLYGKDAELEFIARLRPIRRFRGAGELASAIQKDIRKAFLFFRRSA